MPFSRFWKRSTKRAVTPRELGFQLMKMAATQAFDGPNALDAQLRGVGERFAVDPWVYNTELLIFSAFPYDVLLVTHFGDDAREVRAALVEGTEVFVRQAMLPRWPAQLNLEGWGDRMADRFMEYAAKSMTGDGGKAGISLGLAATKRITGLEDPEMAMYLVIAFTMTIKHMAEPLRGYELTHGHKGGDIR